MEIAVMIQSGTKTCQETKMESRTLAQKFDNRYIYMNAEKLRKAFNHRIGSKSKDLIEKT